MINNLAYKSRDKLIRNFINLKSCWYMLINLFAYEVSVFFLLQLVSHFSSIISVHIIIKSHTNSYDSLIWTFFRFFFASFWLFEIFSFDFFCKYQASVCIKTMQPQREERKREKHTHCKWEYKLNKN